MLAGVGQNSGMTRRLLPLLLLLPFCRPIYAAEADVVIDTAERFVRQQTQGMPGKVEISMGKIDTSKLPPCTVHEPYAPAGTRWSGKVHIGVRCLGPNIWNVLVPAHIAVIGTYIVTSRPLAAGQTIQPNDLSVVTGDLGSQPNGVLGDPAEAIGKTLRNALAGGQPLRGDQLQAPQVIRQGQSVRLFSKGTGFAVSSEGKAINNATVGQLVQVRLASGQTVTGTAQADGSVEISY